MKNNRLLVSLAFLAVVSSGCVKEKDFGEGRRKAGEVIRFTASTEWENTARTKTEYSGLDEENHPVSASSSYERIDWNENLDRIRIYSPQVTGGNIDSGHAANYVVTRVSAPTNEKHVAGIEPVNSEYRLEWGEETEATFFAMYPAPGTESDYAFSYRTVMDEKVSLIYPSIYGQIPAEQEVVLEGNEYKPNMNYAYMYAVTNVDGDEAAVTLSFKPLFTALEVTLLSHADHISEPLRKLELVASEADRYNVLASSRFRADIRNDGSLSSVSAWGDGYSTPTSKSVSITLPGDGIVLGDNPVKVTFLMVPKDVTDLTLKLYFGTPVGGEYPSARSLFLKNGSTPITILACKKLYIRNLDVPNTAFILDQLSPITMTYEGGTSNLASNFHSYKVHGLEKTAVPFDLQYATPPDNLTEEQLTAYLENDGNWSTSTPSWFTEPQKTGSTTGETLEASLAAQTNAMGDDLLSWLRANDSHAIALYNASAKGTSSNPYDLSKYRPAESGSWDNPAATTSTANCYLVHSPGWYKFPLVYGNGVFEGTPNPSAFIATMSNAVTANIRPEHTYSIPHPDGYGTNYTLTYLGNFKDHNDQSIETPYIAAQAAAKGWSVGTPQLLWTDEEGLVTNVSLVGSGAETYIQFEVPKDKILPGNALIAIKDGSGNIAWSWHIWVTDHEYHTLYNGSNGAKFPGYNLGWCDRIERALYLPRHFYVRARQKETGGCTTQPVKVEETEYSVKYPGNNLYYQFGRKDPMMAYISDNPDGDINGDGVRKTYFGEANPHTMEETASLGNAIRNPNVMFIDYDSDSWCSTDYQNLWDSGNNAVGVGTDDAMFNQTDIKTIYDPSPVGFKVPIWGAVSTLGSGWSYPTGPFDGSTEPFGIVLGPHDTNDHPRNYKQWFDWVFGNDTRFSFGSGLSFPCTAFIYYGILNMYNSQSGDLGWQYVPRFGNNFSIWTSTVFLSHAIPSLSFGGLTFDGFAYNLFIPGVSSYNRYVRYDPCVIDTFDPSDVRSIVSSEMSVAASVRPMLDTYDYSVRIINRMWVSINGMSGNSYRFFGDDDNWQ